MGAELVEVVGWARHGVCRREQLTLPAASQPRKNGVHLHTRSLRGSHLFLQTSYLREEITQPLRPFVTLSSSNPGARVLYLQPGQEAKRYIVLKRLVTGYWLSMN